MYNSRPSVLPLKYNPLRALGRVRDFHLGLTGWALYAAYVTRSDNKSRCTHVGTRRLAEDIGCSVKTTQRHRRALLAVGLIVETGKTVRRVPEVRVAWPVPHVRPEDYQAALRKARQGTQGPQLPFPDERTNGPQSEGTQGPQVYPSDLPKESLRDSSSEDEEEQVKQINLLTGQAVEDPPEPKAAQEDRKVNEVVDYFMAHHTQRLLRYQRAFPEKARKGKKPPGHPRSRPGKNRISRVVRRVIGKYSMEELRLFLDWVFLAAHSRASWLRGEEQHPRCRVLLNLDSLFREDKMPERLGMAETWAEDGRKTPVWAFGIQGASASSRKVRTWEDMTEEERAVAQAGVDSF